MQLPTNLNKQSYATISDEDGDFSMMLENDVLVFIAIDPYMAEASSSDEPAKFVVNDIVQEWVTATALTPKKVAYGTEEIYDTETGARIDGRLIAQFHNGPQENYYFDGKNFRIHYDY